MTLGLTESASVNFPVLKRQGFKLLLADRRGRAHALRRNFGGFAFDLDFFLDQIQLQASVLHGVLARNKRHGRGPRFETLDGHFQLVTSGRQTREFETPFGIRDRFLGSDSRRRPGKFHGDGREVVAHALRGSDAHPAGDGCSCGLRSRIALRAPRREPRKPKRRATEPQGPSIALTFVLLCRLFNNNTP